MNNDFDPSYITYDFLISWVYWDYIIHYSLLLWRFDLFTYLTLVGHVAICSRMGWACRWGFVKFFGVLYVLFVGIMFVANVLDMSAAQWPDGVCVGHVGGIWISYVLGMSAARWRCMCWVCRNNVRCVCVGHVGSMCVTARLQFLLSPSHWLSLWFLWQEVINNSRPTNTFLTYKGESRSVDHHFGSCSSEIVIFLDPCSCLPI